MRRGKLIVFTGIDGSGKTTLAKRTLNEFVEMGLHAVYVHGRTRLIITRPLTLLGQRLFLTDNAAANGYSENTKTKNSIVAKHPILRKVYESILMIDTAIQLWWEVGVPLASGKTVICDRYFYDTVATDLAVDMSYTEKETIRRISLLAKLLPPPRVAFLVDVDEEVALARKEDVCSLKYLKDRRTIYLLLAKELDMMTLDGELDEESLLRECLRRMEHEQYI